MNTYENTLQNVRNINQVCINEDTKYKKSLHDKERKTNELQKTKMQEKNKYSETLHAEVMSKCFIFI